MEEPGQHSALIPVGFFLQKSEGTKQKISQWKLLSAKRINLP